MDAPRRIRFLRGAPRPRRETAENRGLAGPFAPLASRSAIRCLGVLPGRGWPGLQPELQRRAPDADAPRRIVFLTRAEAPATGLPTPTLRQLVLIRLWF